MNDRYIKTFGNIFFDIEENKEVKSIIEQASWGISSIITKYGELANEISYGVSRQDDFVDTVICLFIRKIMEQLDAINILFSVGSFTQAQIILRSLIENIISMEFILKEDREIRAAAYYLEHHYQEIELGAKYFDKNSEDGKLIISNSGEKQFDINYNKYKKKKEALKQLVTSKEIFQRVDEYRNKKLCEKKKKRRKKKVYIKWYEVCSSVSNFHGLMKEVGYESYYESIYGGLSYETHALNSTMGMNVDINGISLKKIRNSVGGSCIFSLVCNFSMSGLMKIYEYVNDSEDEKREFQRFFIDFQEKRDIAIHNLDRITSSQSS